MNVMRVVYIDENETQRDYFLFSADNSESFEEKDIVLMHPKDTIEVMLEWIFSENPDGIVIDYKLGDNDSMIEYTGLELLEAIQRQRYGYPCVVITSFFDQDLGDKVSVWRITNKEKVFIDLEEEDLEESEIFFKRLRNDIEAFQQKIDDYLKDCSRLYDKLLGGDINAKEYQEFLDKSTFLESAMVGDERLPPYLEQRDNDSFLKITEEANELIEKIETTENESDD